MTIAADDSARQLAGTTLASSVSEAIARLDSSADDSVTGDDKESYSGGARRGRLQRLQATRELLLGEGGLFATLRRNGSDSL